MTFADKLIRLRRKNGMSQEELAEKLGVSRQAISKWEGLLSVPDLQNVLKISELFNVSTDYLLKDSIEDSEDSVAEMKASAVKEEKEEEKPLLEDFDVFVENEEKRKVNKEISEEERTKNRIDLSNKFFVVAGIFMLANGLVSLVGLITAMITHLTIPTMTFVSIAFSVVSGILMVLTKSNRYCAAIAICLMTVNAIISTINTAMNAVRISSQAFYLMADLIDIAFFIMAIIEFFTDKKGTAVVRVMTVLPAVSSIICSVIYLAYADWSGASGQTFPYMVCYIVEIFIATALYKERIDARTEKENIGIAGITLIVLGIVFNIVVFSIFWRDFRKESVVTIYIIVCAVLNIGGYFFIPWFANYIPKKSTGSECKENGFFELFAHIILTGILAYIYHWIWVYRTTKTVRGYNAGKKASATASIILYIFIPFYHIYWFYKHGALIFEEEKRLGIAEEKESKTAFLFAILTPFVGSAVLQNRINAVALAKCDTADEERQTQQIVEA